MSKSAERGIGSTGIKSGCTGKEKGRFTRKDTSLNFVFLISLFNI